MCNNCSGEFVYLGIKEKLETTVNVDFYDTDVLNLLINIDSFSPFKSSPITVWPVLCKIQSKDDVYEPFTVGVYAGSAKPKSASEYLTKYVQDIQRLRLDGINVQNRHFQVNDNRYICRTPARSL